MVLAFQDFTEKASMGASEPTAKYRTSLIVLSI